MSNLQFFSLLFVIVALYLWAKNGEIKTPRAYIEYNSLLKHWAVYIKYKNESALHDVYRSFTGAINEVNMLNNKINPPRE